MKCGVQTRLAVLFSLSLLCSVAPVFAHHLGPNIPDDDGDSIPANVNIPTVTPIVPAVQAPPPVVVPPPPVINFSLPTIFTNTTILPTDVNNPFIHPDANSIRDLQNRALSKEEIAELMKADLRYQFTGEWLLFAEHLSALPEPQIFKPVGLVQGVQQGHVEHSNNQNMLIEAPTFMPTCSADFKLSAPNQLSLDDGAVLVRAADPVTVITKVRGHEVKTRLSGGAFAMISAFDGKTTILHLTDKKAGGLITYLPSKREQYKVIGLHPGEIAEVYHVQDAPTSNLVSTRVHINERISEERALLLSQCHYVRALKKFNITQHMHSTDYNRVLKTAAAVGYVNRNHK